MATKSNRKVDVFKFIEIKSKDECWPWKRSLRGGKGRPYFTVEGIKYIAYRLVYELFYGVPVPDDKMVRHKCDNGAAPIGCCNPHHMELGDHQDNMNDMKSRERHGLPHHVVKSIKRLLSQGRKHQEIADLYGVSRELVTHINNKRAYDHVQEEDNAEPR